MNNWKRVLVAIVLLGLLLPALAVAQDQVLHVAIQQVTGYPEVVVRVLVADENGRPLRGMESSEFVVQEDGLVVPNFRVVEVERTEPLYIVLVLDTSGSMNGPPLRDAQNAAVEFLDTLRDDDQVAIYSFNEEVTLEAGFTSDRDALVNVIRALATLPPGTGATRLYRAAFDAIQKASEKPLGQRLVLLLSDGQDTASTVTFDDVVSAAKNKAVPVFTVAISAEGDAEFLNQMERLALLAGGIPYQVQGDTEGLSDEFAAIAELLRWQYQVVYNSNAPADGLPHTLTVQVCRGVCAVSREWQFIARASVVTPVPPTATPPPPRSLTLNVIIYVDENNNGEKDPQRGYEPQEGIPKVNIQVIDPRTNESLFQIRTDSLGAASFPVILDRNLRLLIYYIGGYSVEINKDKPPSGLIVLRIPPVAFPGEIP